jgi:hypothetical protein
VIENNGKKLFWDWEHRMRTSCPARRSDLMLEDSEKKEITLIDILRVRTSRTKTGDERRR